MLPPSQQQPVFNPLMSSRMEIEKKVIHVSGDIYVVPSKAVAAVNIIKKYTEYPTFIKNLRENRDLPVLQRFKNAIDVINNAIKFLDLNLALPQPSSMTKDERQSTKYTILEFDDIIEYIKSQLSKK